MSELFDIPETLSPRLAWIKEHGVLTHHAPHCEEAPWIALIPMDGHTGNIGEIMAEWCGLYDEQGLIGYGMTMDEAIVSMAKATGLKLWNESEVKS